MTRPGPSLLLCAVSKDSARADLGSHRASCGHCDTHSISQNASLWGWCVWLSLPPARQDRDGVWGSNWGSHSGRAFWTDTEK